MQPTVPTKRSADVDFFEQLDRVVESMAEEDAGRVPRCLETGPRLEVRAFGKKRRIQRDSSPSPEIALVSPSPSFASFPSSNSLDKTRQHNPRNDSRPATHYTRIASRPATHSSRNASRPTPYNSRNASRPSTRSQTGVVPSSVHSDPFLSTPSNVPSETSPPKLVDHETLTTIAESHSVHISPRGSSACARTLPQSLSPTMGSRTSPQQEKPPQHETPLQQEKAPQQEIPLEQEIVTEAVPTVAKQKKPYSRKKEPVETVATRIGTRRITAAIASSQKRAVDGSGSALRLEGTLPRTLQVRYVTLSQHVLVLCCTDQIECKYAPPKSVMDIDRDMTPKIKSL